MDGNFFSQAILKAAVTHPNQLAFQFDQGNKSKTLTYKALADRAQAIAEVLVKQTSPGDRVLLLFAPSLDFICAFYACCFANVIAVPCYPPMPKSRKSNQSVLDNIIKDCQPSLILTTKNVKALLTALKVKHSFAKEKSLALHQLKTITVEKYLQPSAQFNHERIAQKYDIFYLQYTSGSTGNPKGVALSYDNVTHNCLIIGHNRYQAYDYMMSWLPLYHDMGLVGFVLMPIVLQTPSILCSPMDFLQQPYQWLKRMSQLTRVVTSMPNFGFAYLTKKLSDEQIQSLDLSCCLSIFCGAEPIKPPTIESFYKKFAPTGISIDSFEASYGMAELTLYATSRNTAPIPQPLHLINENKIQELTEKNPNFHHQERLIGCGQAQTEQMTLITVDPESLTVTAEGEIGEIWIQSQSATNYYWNKPGITKQTFQAYTNDGNGPYLRTGDLGVILDNQIYIVGRIKDLIILKGRNFVPQDIEYLAQHSHPQCRKGCSAAYSLQTKTGEDSIAYACEIKKGTSVAEYANIIANIQQAIFDHTQQNVAAIYLLPPNSIPKTTSGKIQRNKTAKLINESTIQPLYTYQSHKTTPTVSVKQPIQPKIHDENKTYIDPNNIKAIQTCLISILKQLLPEHDNNIPASQNLFDLGLDSLTIAEILDQFSQNFKPEHQQCIDLLALSAHPVINDFCRHISNKMSQQQQTDVKIATIEPIQSQLNSKQLKTANRFRLWLLRQMFLHGHRMPNLSSHYQKFKTANIQQYMQVHQLTTTNTKHIKNIINRTVTFSKIYRFRSYMTGPMFFYNYQTIKRAYPELYQANKMAIDSIINQPGGLITALHTFSNMAIALPLLTMGIIKQKGICTFITDEDEVTNYVNQQAKRFKLAIQCFNVRKLANFKKVVDIIKDGGFVFMLPDRFKTPHQVQSTDILPKEHFTESYLAPYHIVKPHTIGLYDKILDDFMQNNLPIYPISTTWTSSNIPSIVHYKISDGKTTGLLICQAMLTNFNKEFEEWTYAHYYIKRLLNDETATA